MELKNDTKRAQSQGSSFSLRIFYPYKTYRRIGRRSEEDEESGCQTDCNFVNATDDENISFANLHTLYNGRVDVRSNQLAGEHPNNSLIIFEVVIMCTITKQINMDSLLTYFRASDSVWLENGYDHVVVIDCTYKTSLYRVPLLHIIGMTAFNTTFTVNLCFLTKER